LNKYTGTQELQHIKSKELRTYLSMVIIRAMDNGVFSVDLT